MSPVSHCQATFTSARERERNGNQCNSKLTKDNSATWPFCGHHKTNSKEHTKAAVERAKQLRDVILSNDRLVARARLYSELACVVVLAKPAFDQQGGGGGDVVEASALARDKIKRFLEQLRIHDACFMEGWKESDVVQEIDASSSEEEEAWSPDTLVNRITKHDKSVFYLIILEGQEESESGDEEMLMTQLDTLMRLDNTMLMHIRSKRGGVDADFSWHPEKIATQNVGGGWSVESTDVLEVSKEFSLGKLSLCGRIGVVLRAVEMFYLRMNYYWFLELPTDVDRSPSDGAVVDTQQDEQPAKHEMALFPRAGAPPHGFDASCFKDRLCTGKYGDPADEIQWEHYMAGNDTRAQSGPNVDEPSSSNSSPGVGHPPPSNSNAVSNGVETINDDILPISHMSTAATNVNSSVASSKKTRHWKGSAVKVLLSLGEGVMHVPEAHEWVKESEWMPQIHNTNAANDERIRVRIPANTLSRTCIRFPIFTPSCGRASTALLNLTSSMPSGYQYLQVVVVKADELDEYRALWPKLILFQLPKKASDLGIGAARACIKELAEKCLPLRTATTRPSGSNDPPRCAFIMDDSVLCWKVDCGIPGDSDSCIKYMKGLAGNATTSSTTSPEETQLSRRLRPVHLGTVLMHFQHADCNLRGVGVLGFHRYNALLNWQRAYSCGHVYSAVLLNLDELSDVHFDPNLHVWEDIDFNRRVAGRQQYARDGFPALSPGLPVIKCFRFLMVKKQMKSGGCCKFTQRVERMEDAEARSETGDGLPRSEDDEVQGQVNSSCFWDFVNGASSKTLEKMYKDHAPETEKGRWDSATVPILRRRLVALQFKSLKEEKDRSEAWEDWRFWQALSPCNATDMTIEKLVEMALTLQISGSSNDDANLRHRPALKTELMEWTKEKLLSEIVQQMRSMSEDELCSCLGAAAALEDSAEKWRQATFDDIFFSPEDGLLTKTPLSDARIVAEVHWYLKWAGKDVQLVNKENKEVLDSSRKIWLNSVKEKLKKIGDRRFWKGALDNARDAVNHILGAIKWEIGSVKCCDSDIRSVLKAHHTAHTMHIYRDEDIGTRNKSIAPAAKYFSDAGCPTINYHNGVLRVQQKEALDKAKEHHSKCEELRDKQEEDKNLNEEVSALRALRSAYGELVRQSYYELEETEKTKLEEKVREQKRNLHNCMAKKTKFKEDNTSLLVLPTGLGKTGVMCLLPFVLPLKRTGRVLVIAPNLTIVGKEDTDHSAANGLLKDFGDKTQSFYRRFGLLPDDADLPRVMSLEELDRDKAWSPQLLSADIVIANFQKLPAIKQLETQFDRRFFDAVIVDEAHHTPSQDYKMILEYFSTAHKVLLTATPYRADCKELNAKEIYRCSISECIGKGYIKNIAYCPVAVKAYTLKSHTLEYKINGWSAIQEDGMKTRTHSIVTSSESVRNSIIQTAMDCLRWLRNLSDYRHQAIVQADDVKDAKKICKEWNKYQENDSTHSRMLCIDYVASKRPKKDNDKVMGKLRSGELDIIVHVGMLGEGFDHPGLSVAVIFRPFKSIAPFAQFIGRAVRKNPELDKKQHKEADLQQIAYVIAHPACGAGKVWEAFRNMDKGTNPNVRPAMKLDWDTSSHKDELLKVTEHVTAPSIFKNHAKLRDYIKGRRNGDDTESNHITLFKDNKGPPQTPASHLDASALWSTGTSPASPSTASVSPEVQGASTSRHGRPGNSRVVRQLNPELENV